MTTQRMVLDTRGKDILTIFTENIDAIGALNQLAASPADGGVYHGPNEEDVNIPEEEENVEEMSFKGPETNEDYDESSEDEDNPEEEAVFNSDEANTAKTEKETGQIVSLDSFRK